MPAIAAAPAFYAAIATGAATVGTGVMSNRAQSRSNRDALAASERGAQRAEAFERDQDSLQRADDTRREAEERRRFDIEQQNIEAERREQTARQRYEDGLRYQRMVNIAQLTGRPVPPPPPFLSGGQPQGAPQGMPLRQLSRRPPVSSTMPVSRTKTMIQGNTDPLFDPLAEQRMPLRKLSGPRY
jgi:hypothetical protein